MIHFPVLRKVEIKNYQLYKNDQSNELTHQLDGGVHLIVGVNGLGKTTLLNAIYRLLVGPKDAPKGGDTTLGSSKHELIDWKKKKYFSSRVKDTAVEATVEGEVTFGNRSLKIKRKLSNLEVVTLSVDGEEQDASQESYEERIVELCGLPGYVDFFSVVKFLVFFLEDRSDLIWDYKSQFEIFRILFFDTEIALKTAEHRDNARKADSNYRNLHSSFNNALKELKRLESEDGDAVRTEYLSAQSVLNGIDECYTNLSQQNAENVVELEKGKLAVASLKREFDEYKYGIEQRQHQLVSQHYPDLSETVKILLSNLSSGGGCFVCGNEEVSVGNRIISALKNQTCPVCHSSHEQQEIADHVVDSKKTEEKRIAKLQRQSLDTLESLEAQSSQVEELEAERERTQQEIVGISQNRLVWLEKLRKLSKRLPDEDSSVEELSRQINVWKGLLAQYSKIRREETIAYRETIATQQSSLDEKLKEVRARFEYFSSKLLSERVMLKKDTVTKPLGVGGEEKVTIPCFKVYMTSGVHRESPELRESHEQVSESQREFIDLAFRLAIFDVVTEGRDSPSMIVMETPEASLDSIFMQQISHLFRTFGAQHDGRNVLLASTNLNQSEMISSLLGVSYAKPSAQQTRLQRMEELPGDDPNDLRVLAIPVKERNAHVINLLELAAPNAALTNNREFYDSLFKRAVFPDNATITES